MGWSAGFPFGALQKIGVVELLDVAEAFGRLFAAGDAREFAEIFETLDTGSDDDQQLGAFAASGCKCVRQARRNNDDVAAVGLDDFLAGENLHGTVEDVKHFGGMIVMMGARAVGVRGERDLHGRECAAGGVAVDEEFDLGGCGADNFGVVAVYVDGMVWVGKDDGHGFFDARTGAEVAISENRYQSAATGDAARAEVRSAWRRRWKRCSPASRRTERRPAT